MPLKLDMVAYVYNHRTLKAEDQEFKVILGCTVILKPVWAT